MFLHVKYIKNDNDLLCYSCLLIRYWTLCGALFAGLFWINSSSFDFARREWVEKSSGHFLQRRELNQRTSCQHGVCRRPASVWSDAVCRCHVYLICTDSKRMFGRTSINTFFFFFLMQTLYYCLNISVPVCVPLLDRKCRRRGWKTVEAGKCF